VRLGKRKQRTPRRVLPTVDVGVRLRAKRPRASECQGGCPTDTNIRLYDDADDQLSLGGVCPYAPMSDTDED
jgi:hypothetical protein